LEHCIREELNANATRVMAVLDPVKVVITNYPEGEVEWLETENNPEKPEAGKRKIAFSREIYIEREDFMENPPKKFFRLSPGNEVRLKSAYIIKCEEVIKDEAGNILEIRCTYDPDSKSGGPNAGRKVKGTLHWVAVNHSIPAEVRLYEHLFTVENPDEDEDGVDFRAKVNPNSLTILSNARVEPILKEALMEDRFQFLRQGYFCLDLSSTPDKLVFNRIVSLKDTWAKMQKKG
ncbi:MAG: glutamine--tRNA ligase, partial [Syntrophomonadaceae bacterium]|nr:glutamine--tRNA ligase [Syntrophomonadaceae bacterium]